MIRDRTRSRRRALINGRPVVLNEADDGGTFPRQQRRRGMSSAARPHSSTASGGKLRTPGASVARPPRRKDVLVWLSPRATGAGVTWGRPLRSRRAGRRLTLCKKVESPFRNEQLTRFLQELVRLYRLREAGVPAEWITSVSMMEAIELGLAKQVSWRFVASQWENRDRAARAHWRTMLHRSGKKSREEDGKEYEAVR